MTSPRTVLLVAPATSYRVEPYVAAARRLGVELVIATDLPAAMRSHAVEVLPVDLAARSFKLDVPFDAVVAVDEASAIVAARLAAERGVPFHSTTGVEACADKLSMRRALSAAGVPVPPFVPLATSSPWFPCVVKPRMLSGSQGVIRADDPAELQRAAHRVRAILERHPSPRRAAPGFFEPLVERYVEGPEVAVEGLVHHGELHVLAVFDKPDELCGPYFEETIYVTPSRHPASSQDAVVAVVRQAVAALDLGHGPVHAELRLGEGPVLVEIAPRSIGGLCSRAFAPRLGSLEERVLRGALGEAPIPVVDGPAVGVMMIPVPSSGVLRTVRGVEAAREVPCVDAVSIAVDPGQSIHALPEGASYLGFIFAHAPSPAEVEEALRAAHRELYFELKPLLRLG